MNRTNTADDLSSEEFAVLGDFMKAGNLDDVIPGIARDRQTMQRADRKSRRLPFICLPRALPRQIDVQEAPGLHLRFADGNLLQAGFHHGYRRQPAIADRIDDRASRQFVQPLAIRNQRQPLGA